MSSRCTDNLQGSPSFTISTKKEADGKYTATCDSLPALKPITERSEVDAIRALKTTMESYMLKGGR